MFSPVTIVLALGYGEKSKPGVKGLFLVDTSGSGPWYLVHVNIFCAEK